jgi:hypothetical protein
VYQWLRDNYRDVDIGIYGEPLFTREAEGRRLIEFILSRRRDKLIDHGLARYGCSSLAIQRAYDRGDISTKYAALPYAAKIKGDDRSGWAARCPVLNCRPEQA